MKAIMCRGERTGIGIFRSARGAYNGQFKDGLRAGQGYTFIWKNGDIYVGDWMDDLQNGRGKLTKKRTATCLKVSSKTVW